MEPTQFADPPPIFEMIKEGTKPNVKVNNLIAVKQPPKTYISDSLKHLGQFINNFPFNFGQIKEVLLMRLLLDNL